MTNTANTSRKSLSHRFAWIAAFTFLVSLISPMLTLAAPADDDPLDHATICDPGYVWNDKTQQCDPPPDIPVVDPNANEQPACGEGEVPNGNGGCIPDQQPACPDGQVLDDNGTCQPLPPPPCPDGTVRDDTGNCMPAQQPEPPDCKDGFILDEDWACVPDPEIQPSDCKDGKIYDQDIPGCVQDPDTPPDCKAGEVYDQDIPGCVPKELAKEPTPDCPDSAPLDKDSGKCVPSTETPTPMQDCGIGANFDEDTGTCVPAAVPTQPPGVDQIVVTKYACPTGTDPESSIDVLLVECTIEPGIDFTVRENPGGASGSTKTTDANGRASWFALWDTDAGWTVEEVVPPTYGRPVIFWRQIGGIPVHHPPEEWLRYGNLFYPRVDGIHVGPGWGTHELSWFNFPANDQGVMLAISKHDCPADTPRDLHGWRNYEMLCTAAEEGVEFTLTVGGSTTTKTTGIDGTIVWGEIPIGPWSIQEILHVGYGDPVVRCHWINLPDDSALSDQPEPMTPTRGAVTGTFTSDHHGLSRWCHWMNIPLELPGLPTASCGVGSSPCPPDLKEPVGNHISLTYHWCTKEISPSTDLEQLITACPVIEGVGFTGTFGEQIETGKTDAKGRIAFNDLPQGEWSITPIGRDTKSDTIQMLAGCDIHLGLEAQNPLLFENVERITGDFDRPDGITWDCHWVDIVLDPGAGNQILITKYACGAGIQPETSLGALRTLCTPARGVRFEIGSGRTPYYTDSSGHLALDHQPSGHWLVMERPPAGYGQPVVFCRTTIAGVASAWALMPRSTIVWGDFTPGATTTTECEWFNLLADEQGVFLTITKLTCPPGFARRGVGWREYLGACSPSAGVDFTATFAGAVSTATTGRDGEIHLDEVPIGAWTLAESIPAGYGEPIVFCHWNGYSIESGLHGGPIAFSSSGGSVSGTHGEDDRGLRRICYWVNFPVDSTPPPLGRMANDSTAILPGSATSSVRA